jgi:hypothetical protein
MCIQSVGPSDGIFIQFVNPVALLKAEFRSIDVLENALEDSIANCAKLRY